MNTLTANLTLDMLVARHGPRYKWFALLIVATGMIAGVLSTTSFTVAIPALARGFGLAQDQVQWAITGFMAAMTVAMLPTPWFINRLGFRQVFVGALIVLLLASLLGAMADSFALVVAARIVQGAAAGVLQPLGPMAVMRLFPSDQQGRASGVLGFGIVLAPAVAPTLGGLLLDHFGWAAIFLLDVPFCLLAAGLALRWLPAPRSGERQAFDWTGMALLSLITLCLLQGVAGIQHRDGSAWLSLALAALGLLALTGFIRHARRVRHPIISLGLFRHRAFTMGAIVSFAYGFGLFASTYLIPIFLQNAVGYTATAAGFALLPSGIALALTIPLAGRLADRYPAHWITAGGLAMFALSFGLFAWFSNDLSYGELVTVTVIGRIGLGLVLPALSLATLRHLEPHQLGQSAMVISYLRQIGGVLGIAIAAVFVGWRESVYGHSAPGIFTAFAQSFELLAVVFLAALAAASQMRPSPRKEALSG